MHLFISVQDLNFVVLVAQCLMSHNAPQAAGKPSIKDTFKQYPATCALLTCLLHWPSTYGLGPIRPASGQCGLGPIRLTSGQYQGNN